MDYVSRMKNNPNKKVKVQITSSPAMSIGTLTTAASYVSHMKKNPKKKVKVQITLTEENRLWLEERLEKWNAQGISFMCLNDLVQGCVTLCRTKDL